MYNTDFLPQINGSGRYFFGAGVVDFRDAADRAASRGYVPPPDVEILSCHEGENGEWVPNPVRPASEPLEEKADSK